MTIVFYPTDYCQKWPKKFKIFFDECLRSTLHKSLTKFLKKNKNDKIWRGFGNFYQNLQMLIFEKNNALKYAVIWQKNGKKWQLCFTPQIIAENDQKNSKSVLVYVSGTLCTNCLKKNKNDKIWRFLGNFLKKTKKQFPKNENFWLWKIEFFDKKQKKIQKNENFLS